MNIAVVGYGYWGPNLVRNFSWLEGTNVKYVCDTNQERLTKVKPLFPNVGIVTTDYQQVLADPEVEAVAISTPVNTHFDLTREALNAGKHVLVEKPMTDNVKKAGELVKLSKSKNKILMVDHTFLYTGAVKKMKELIHSGGIGDILYFDSVRVNLGLFQNDVNVLWDLAPHDLSILNYLLDKKPVQISATGVAHVEGGMENIAYMTIFYEDTTIAHFHVNWLSPIKVRQIMIGGRNKMIVYDDMENTEKIKVYDKGIEINQNDKDAIYKTLIQYRTGDMFAPKLDGSEALKVECQHFIECIEQERAPISDAEFGLEVVRMLEASQLSIKQHGKIVKLDSI